MTSWLDVREALERLLSADRVNEDMVLVDVSVQEADRRKVAVRHEVVPGQAPDQGLDFVAIDAHVGAVGHTDLMSAVAQVGQLVPGLLGYAQGSDSGVLSVGTRMPTALLDGGQMPTLLMLVYLLASAASAVERELVISGSPYAYRSEEIRRAAWEQIRQSVLQDSEFAVDRDFGDGFIF